MKETDCQVFHYMSEHFAVISLLWSLQTLHSLMTERTALSPWEITANDKDSHRRPQPDTNNQVAKEKLQLEGEFSTNQHSAHTQHHHSQEEKHRDGCSRRTNTGHLHVI